MTQIIGQESKEEKNSSRLGFKKRSQLHQSKYRKTKLNKVAFDKLEHILTEHDAKLGRNFYKGFDIFQEVGNRYSNYSKRRYANMLCSEHIPFNLFIPFNSNLDFAKSVFNDLLSGQIKSIDKIEIEYAPSPAKDYLNDKTSFDTYIEYTHIDNQKGIIGIEVKYTEKGYSQSKDSKQAKESQDKTSIYYNISEQCGIYKPDTTDLLITNSFRQFWRNQLLGESIIIVDNDKFKHFTSMTVFPKGNSHFVEASKEYMDMLKTNEDRFVPVTYEKFISVCEEHVPDEKFEKWLEYLKERYIIED